MPVAPASPDVEAERRAFVESNLGLVYSQAKKLVGKSGMTYHELITEGVFALIDCARLYTPDKGRPSTYCVPAIQHRMWREIRLRQAKQLPQEPPARETGDSDHAPHLDSITEDQNRRKAKGDPDLDLMDELNGLDEIAQMIVRWRLGLRNGKPADFETIGKRLGMPGHRVERIHKTAMQQLRLALRNRKKGAGDE